MNKIIWYIYNSNMTSFKCFESKPVVKIILIYDRLNLWRHRQFISIFYQFLHIRIEIIHGSHMYILFLLRVSLYVSFLPLACARCKTSWHKGIPVVKTIYTYGFHELFLKYNPIGNKPSRLNIDTFGYKEFMILDNNSPYYNS